MRTFKGGRVRSQWPSAKVNTGRCSSTRTGREASILGGKGRPRQGDHESEWNIPLDAGIEQLAVGVRRRPRSAEVGSETGVLDPLRRISVSLSGRLGAGGSSRAPEPPDC